MTSRRRGSAVWRALWAKWVDPSVYQMVDDRAERVTRRPFLALANLLELVAHVQRHPQLRGFRAIAFRHGSRRPFVTEPVTYLRDRGRGEPVGFADCAQSIEGRQARTYFAHLVGGETRSRRSLLCRPSSSCAPATSSSRFAPFGNPELIGEAHDGTPVASA